MKALQERYKDDKPKLQQEMMKLYQEEKVNPMAGCLPILLQIPIFYALYKVLMLAVEMRHQPFVLWIKDLSAPDPLTPVNLFGYLPFTPPRFLAIGVLPILLGITMWLQIRLNPQPMPDPVQQQIFALMPWVLMFVMAPFAAGLQLYWVTNNILSIAQQQLALQPPSGAEGAAAGVAATAPAATPKPKPANVSDADAIWSEAARKLFSGPIAFLKSAPELEFLPDPDVPEIAFAGRSNVGKSSLLNALTNRNSLARTSNTPGRTQELNFFDVGEPLRFRLVDMPGYGFAKAPKDVARKWRYPDQRLSARPAGAEARAGADRQPPRPQGDRPRDHEDARRRRGQLPPRPDQGRQDQGDRARRGRRRAPPRRRASTPPRIPRSSSRRAKPGSAWIALRAAVLEAALDLIRTGDDDMLKLIIGNKAYSSWSLRGWLAVKQSGLPFEEITVPMFDEEWDKRTEGDEFAPSGGKVPILWDDQTVIWDSLAIIEWLADKTDRARYWPRDDTARGMARSMAAEMHSGYRQSAPRAVDERAQAIPDRRAHRAGQGRDPAHPRAVGAGARAARRRRPLSVRRFRRGRHHVRAGRHPLRHLFGPGPALRRRLYGDDPRPCLDAANGSRRRRRSPG